MSVRIFQEGNRVGYEFDGDFLQDEVDFTMSFEDFRRKHRIGFEMEEKLLPHMKLRAQDTKVIDGFGRIGPYVFVSDRDGKRIIYIIFMKGIFKIATILKVKNSTKKFAFWLDGEPSKNCEVWKGFVKLRKYSKILAGE